MKLLNLKVENFQGIDSLEIEADGNDLSIKGENGTGKTTVANAIAWLLFGKSSTGEKGYSPKTIDEDGNEVHYLHHSADGVFQLDDKSQLTLKKDYYESWQKVRGQNTESFKGHITDHFIDGVPVKEKDYIARLDEIFSSEQAMMLTIPEYFADTMPWQKRREILLEVCGDITDEEILESTEELKELKPYLLKPGTTDQYYTVEDYTAIAKSKKAKVNDELKNIPTRIDEAKKAIPEILGTASDIEEQTIRFEKEKEELNNKLASFDATSNSEYRKELAEIEADLMTAKNIYNKTYEEKVTDDKKVISIKKEERSNLQDKYRNTQSKIKSLDEDIKRMEERRLELTEEYREVQEEAWKGDGVCGACGQALPAEQIEDAKAKFNQAKSKRLEYINTRGAEYSKAKLAGLNEEANELREALSKLEAEGVSIAEEILKLEAKVEPQVAYEDTEEYALAQAKMLDIKEKMEDATKDTEEQKEPLKLRIEDLNKSLSTLSDLKQDIKVAEQQKKRIKELAAEEKELAKNYEHVERGVYLCEEFTRQKASMLDEKINGKFESVRFKLFTEQVNGGQADSCTVLVQTTEGLKPFVKANTGAKIRAAVEIMDTLGDHWGIHLPLLLDNYESITNDIKNTEAQKIKFYAVEGASKLQIEKEK